MTSKKKMSKYDLLRDMVDDDFHDPWIITGYREPNLTFAESIKSAFVLSCNESFNILSHVVAFFYLAMKYYNLFTKELLYTDHIHWPLICQCLGILGFCIMSSLAHMFNSMSKQARNRCFFFDYAAISIFSVGAGIAFYFYERPLHPEFDISVLHPVTFTSISIAVSVLSTSFCCQSRTKWTSNKYLLRTFAYTVPFIFNSFPYFYRLYSCKTDIDCDTTNLAIYLKQMFYMVAASIANVSKIPERFIPCKFDAIGQSHHIMHILFPIACDTQFEFLRMEMEQKHGAILQNAVQPNTYNVIVPMISAVFINLLIAYFTDARPTTSIKTVPRKKGK